MRAKNISLDKREPSCAEMLTRIQPFMDLEQGNKTNPSKSKGRRLKITQCIYCMGQVEMLRQRHRSAFFIQFLSKEYANIFCKHEDIDYLDNCLGFCYFLCFSFEWLYLSCSSSSAFQTLCVHAKPKSQGTPAFISEPNSLYNAWNLILLWMFIFSCPEGL